MLFTLLAFLTLPAHAATCGPANPAEFAARPDRPGACSVDGSDLYVSGIIDADLLASVNEALSTQPIARVFLNSYGGNYQAGLELGRLVQSRGLTTVVPSAEDYCVSACTYVFQAGRERLAHPGAVFGYHGAVLGGSLFAQIFENQCGAPPYSGDCAAQLADLENTARQAARDIFGALEKLGASPQLFEMYMNGADNPNWFEEGEFTHKKVLVLRGKQLLGYGVVTKLY